MPDDDLSDVFLGRQPILDREQQLYAYELLFRNGRDDDSGVAIADGDLATATVISNAFGELSMADALGPYPGFIKVDAGLLLSELIDALPARNVVLEVLERVEATPEVIERCTQLRQAGYTLAVGAQAGEDLRQAATIVKVDIGQYGPPHLAQIVAEQKSQGKTLVAEKVESHAQMLLCHELGFDLFQGYYFARPTLIQGKHPHPSDIALLRLLGLLSQDASDNEIETIFRQNPLLTVNLLRLINSASSGVATRVTSLRHAISLLGRRQLLRWLQLLLYSNLPQSRQSVNPLLQLAATRGRLMELLVAHVDDPGARQRESVDQAYMVGILSLMPTLFSCSMPDLLAQLPVAATVDGALRAHHGMLGTLLALVETLEDPAAASPASPSAAELLRRLPGIDPAVSNACLSTALGWANNLAREAC